MKGLLIILFSLLGLILLFLYFADVGNAYTKELTDTDKDEWDGINDWE